MKFKINNESLLWVVYIVTQMLFVYPYILMATTKEIIAPIYELIFFIEAPVVTTLIRIFNRYAKTTVIVEDGVMKLWRLVLLRKVKLDNIIGLEYSLYWRIARTSYYTSDPPKERRAKLIITIRDNARTHKVVLTDLASTRLRPLIERKKFELIPEEDVQLFQLYNLLSELTGLMTID